MKTSTPIASIKHEPEGLYIFTKVQHLLSGEYAFVRSNNGGTDVLKFTKSHGTDFYKPECTIDIQYSFIQASKLFQPYTVELNACPGTSDTMDYAEALLFSI